MLTYQEYLYFIDRYKHTVYSSIAERLFSYVVYPTGRERDPKEREKRKQRHNYKDYDWYDMSRFYTVVDGQRKLVIPDGPFDYKIYHGFRPPDPNPELFINKLGNTQYDNFCRIISGVTDTQFPDIIEKYASSDCDCTNSKDCVDDLERKLKIFWKLT